MIRFHSLILSVIFAVTTPLFAATDAQLAVVAGYIQKGQTLGLGEVNRLLKAEPADPTLLALRDQLSAATPNPPPSSTASRSATPPPVPAPTGPALTRLDKLELQTIQSLLADAKTRDDFTAVARRTDGLLAKYPDYYELWLLRAGTAAALDDKESGVLATRRLLALGILERDDPQTDQVLLTINKKEWIAAAKEAQATAERVTAFHRRMERAEPLTFNMTPSVEFTVVPLKPGTFRQGDSSIARTVTLTKPFWLGPTEVTQELYEAVIGKNPSHFKGPKRPVENVSYDDALAFCTQLTASYAYILPPGWKFTLPTEAQWEYACRAGTTGDYAGNLDEMAWYDKTTGTPNFHDAESVKIYFKELSRKERAAKIGTIRDYTGTSTRDVANKKPNAWGLYDMHGNVWEWCLDWYGDYTGGSATDPRGLCRAPAASSAAVVGGNAADSCRSAFRGRNAPGFRVSGLGFRVALSSGQ